jgi:cellulose synthase/poly-beta-1,6-N-acetylglucosamine synthase-like glycosyltransferase
MAALQDIREEFTERGFTLPRFIQDRTVIEDTESTIDLAMKGWRLHNHTARLAYSATPPDFGALLIQRRRWANGGLIIFPKLLRHILSWKAFRKNPLLHVMEAVVRSNYLLSLTFVNIGLLIMLSYSFEDCTVSLWLPLTALPYYFLYARDLRLNGYRYSDILNVYALNLVLIPVNLGGVVKSIVQAVSGKPSTFKRTPKVTGRTAAPWLYVALELALLASWILGMVFGFIQNHPVSAVLAGVHALLLGYGLVRFLGTKEIYEDIHLGLEQELKTADVAA